MSGCCLTCVGAEHVLSSQHQQVGQRRVEAASSKAPAALGGCRRTHLPVNTCHENSERGKEGAEKNSFTTDTIRQTDRQTNNLAIINSYSKYVFLYFFPSFFICFFFLGDSSQRCDACIMTTGNLILISLASHRQPCFHNTTHTSVSGCVSVQNRQLVTLLTSAETTILAFTRRRVPTSPAPFAHKIGRSRAFGVFPGCATTVFMTLPCHC